jgi:O-antigen/teichoic acid export membrane protein
VTYLISWSLGGAVVLAASWVADFYNIAGLEELFYVLSVNFFLAPFVSIPYALLQRTMSFGKLLAVMSAGVVVGFVVTIVSILSGLSYYSMAIGLTANSLTQLLLANILIPRRYWRPEFHQIMPVMCFGFYSSASNMMKKSLLTVPDVIIGKMGTTTQVGFFSRGLGFVEFLSASVQQGVSPVILPFLSGKVRARENVGAPYLRAGVMLGAILWPVLTVAAINSLSVVRFFFGDQWDEAAPLASILAIWAMCRCVNVFLPELLLSIRAERLLMIRELLLLSVCIVGVWVLFPFGLKFAALAFVAVGAVDLVFGAWILTARMNLRPADIALAWLPNLGLASVCGLVSWTLKEWFVFDESTPWFAVLILALVLTPVWYLGLGMVRNPLWDEIKPKRLWLVWHARHG